MTTIHTFESTGEAYDAVQCSDQIKKGDLLLVQSEKVVGIAYTWPFAVTLEHGSLHHIARNEDGAKIIEEFAVPFAEACELATDLGYTVNPR